MLCHSHQLMTGTIVLLAFIVLYLIYDGVSSISAMAEQPETSSAPLEVVLAPSSISSSSNLGSIVIHITIKNLAPHPVSILRWSSPLDLHATAIGVFIFTSTTSKIPAPCLNMKINYQLPTTGYFASDDENIIHIPAYSDIERNLDFKEPEVALTKGDTYSVHTQGSWKGVWTHETENDASKLYLDDAGLKRYDFKSNEIVVEILEGEGAEL